MLFSNRQIAQFINDNFEPVWQSVRPVPTIKIDFGNGKVARRTLHGNIATYVCTSTGTVLDVLPGLYQPSTYLDDLMQFRLLSRYFNEKGQAELVNYHIKQAHSLESRFKPCRLVAFKNHVQLLEPQGTVPRLAINLDPTRECPDLTSPEAIRAWQALTAETMYNDTFRRLQIHKKLVAGGATAEQLTTWLYKEVLHTDLNDPYLGLKETLSQTYPFSNGALH